MTGAEHYAEAERLAASAYAELSRIEDLARKTGVLANVHGTTTAAIGLAQVHATLALVVESAFRDGMRP